MSFLGFFINHKLSKVIRLVVILDFFWDVMIKVLIEFEFCGIVALSYLLLVLFLLPDGHHNLILGLYFSWKCRILVLFVCIDASI